MRNRIPSTQSISKVIIGLFSVILLFVSVSRAQLTSAPPPKAINLVTLGSSAIIDVAEAANFEGDSASSKAVASPPGCLIASPVSNYDPHCFGVCDNGPGECSTCASFVLQNNCGCCIATIAVESRNGVCFLACGATDVPIRPSWIVVPPGCTTGAKKMYPSVKCAPDCDGLCPGQAVLVQICATVGDTFDFYYNDCSGAVQTVSVVVP